MPMKTMPDNGRHEGQGTRCLRRCLALSVFALCIPLTASDYLTEGHDPGRTGWMKDEKVARK